MLVQVRSGYDILGKPRPGTTRTVPVKSG